MYFVIFAHSQLLVNTLSYHSGNPIWRFFSRLAYLSDVSVDAFFCISGFLISYLLLEEEANNGRINIANFYMRRVLRIWPLYFFILVTGFVFFPLIANLCNIQYVVNYNYIYFLLFCGNYDLLRVAYMDLTSNPIIAPLWSISVEEQFYLIWPLLIFFSRNKKILIIIAIISVSFAFRLFHSQDWLTVYYSSVGSFFFLAAGSALAYFVHQHSDALKRMNELPKSINIAVYLLLASTIYATAPYYKSIFVMRDVLIAVFICWVILEQSFYKNSFVKFGRIKFLDFWGKYTYGMYLWHSVCIYIIDIIFKANGWWASDSFAVIPYLLCILILTHVVSYISYYYFESIFLRLKYKFA